MPSLDPEVKVLLPDGTSRKLTEYLLPSALLMLSAFWTQARAAVVNPLPSGLRERLPLVNRPVSPAPAA